MKITFYKIYVTTENVEELYVNCELNQQISLVKRWQTKGIDAIFIG